MRSRGSVGSRDRHLLEEVVQQQHQEVIAAGHVVIEGGRSDPHLAGEMAHGESTCAVTVDHSPGCDEDLGAGGDRGATGSSGALIVRHGSIMPHPSCAIRQANPLA